MQKAAWDDPRLPTADFYIPTYDDVLAAHERVRPYIHRTPILTSRFLNELDRRRALLQVREPAEGRRLQGARRLQRGLRPLRREGGEGRRHPLVRQPRPLALLRRRPPRHPLQRGDAAHGPPGEEGRRPRLRRRHHRMRALDLLARGDLRQGPGRDRRRLRPPLQRRARHRRPGHLLEGDDRGPRAARCGRRPDRRRRDDLGHLPDALDHRAARRRSTPPSPSRPTTPTSRSSRAS